VDVKAQSHSKLYNKADSLLGSHTGETGRRETEFGKKRRACMSVYPLRRAYNMLHMNCWWIGKIKHWQLTLILFKLL